MEGHACYGVFGSVIDYLRGAPETSNWALLEHFIGSFHRALVAEMNVHQQPYAYRCQKGSVKKFISIPKHSVQWYNLEDFEAFRPSAGNTSTDLLLYLMRNNTNSLTDSDYYLFKLAQIHENILITEGRLDELLLAAKMSSTFLGRQLRTLFQ